MIPFKSASIRQHLIRDRAVKTPSIEQPQRHDSENSSLNQHDNNVNPIVFLNKISYFKRIAQLKSRERDGTIRREASGRPHLAELQIVSLELLIKLNEKTCLITESEEADVGQPKQRWNKSLHYLHKSRHKEKGGDHYGKHLVRLLYVSDQNTEKISVSNSREVTRVENEVIFEK